jgi:hypothetical protein
MDLKLLAAPSCVAQGPVRLSSISSSQLLTIIIDVGASRARFAGKALSRITVVGRAGVMGSSRLAASDGSAHTFAELAHQPDRGEAAASLAGHLGLDRRPSSLAEHSFLRGLVTGACQFHNKVGVEGRRASAFCRRQTSQFFLLFSPEQQIHLEPCMAGSGFAGGERHRNQPAIRFKLRNRLESFGAHTLKLLGCEAQVGR